MSKSECDPTVEWFVEKFVTVTEGGESTDLEEFWVWYGPRANGVPREGFKWHLIQALPDSVERDGNTLHGVVLSEKTDKQE